MGGAVAGVLIVGGLDPVLATGASFVAGALAGATTGVLHTRFRINGLLAGILVMTALYSINLHVMGKSNLPLLSERTLASMAESGALSVFGAPTVSWFGWEVATRDVGRTRPGIRRWRRSLAASSMSSSRRTLARPCRPPATTPR